MSQRSSPQGKQATNSLLSISVPNGSVPLTTSQNNQNPNLASPKSPPAPPPPQIFLNNLNLASANSSKSSSTVSNNKASCNSLNTQSTTVSNNNNSQQNNAAPANNTVVTSAHSSLDSNSHSAPETSSTITSSQEVAGSPSALSKARNNLYARFQKHPRLSRDVGIDIEDNEDADSVDLEAEERADEFNDSAEHNNLLFRLGSAGVISDTLRVPGIFTNARRILSSENLLEGEMSEEKLLKALEDDEARDHLTVPPSRWRKTSESNGLNKSPRPPLRNSKSSSALLTNRQPPIGVTTQNSLWMSHDNGDDYLKHECDEKCSSTLHMAVKTGNLDEVEIMLETGADPNARDCYGRTPLHYAVTMGCNCDSCTATAARCTQLLVDSAKTDIDIQDNQGETPLHLAAENQATKCASILLYSAADVSIKSKAGVKALTLMVEKIPDAMDSLLNRAVAIEKYDPTNVKCELKLDFGAIVGYSETRGYSQRKGKTGGATNGENGNVKARKEMQLLTLILDCSSSARKKILTHPLIAIFLYLKWKCVRTVFWLTILLHVVLLMLYTLYILDVYLISCPYRPKITEPAAVKAAKAEGNYLQSENSTYRAEFIKFSWFEFSPQLQELGTIKSNLYEDGCPLEIGPTVKSVLLLALTILMVTNEVFKMLPAPRSYWKRTNNRLQWTLFLFIFLTSWPVFMSHPNINFWQYQAAAFGLFLAWGLMLSQIGKFPILGLYVEILTKVLKNFGFFMVTYASLLMAFALAFCVLFPGNAPYSSIPLAILKVLMMMVGEVNYEDLFYGNEENPVDDLLYPITGHFLYGAFVIMITIVLMNLLVGLTVSDIQGLQKDAELTRLSRQIGEISQLESFVFSKRVQSFLPNSFAAFLRESVLVVRPKYNEDKQTPASPKDFKDSSWYFHLRPNDPNDKAIPEDLKVAVLRIAAARHRTKRTNRCTKNFHRGTAAPATPLLEEYQRYASTHSGASGWLPPPYQRILNRTLDPSLQAQQSSGIPSTGATVPPWAAHATNRTRIGQGPSAAIRDPPEYTYFMKRLEEKIMDRMKIQMDTLYQKIEDKMMNMP